MSTAMTENQKMPLEAYQYQPLDSSSGEIRLVKIVNVKEDGARKSDIEMELQIIHTPLAQCDPYMAISYAWGNPASTHRLLLDGAALFVPENTFRTLYTVHHALRTSEADIHSAAEQPLLWIDAICLNQSDIAEKNKQVPRMGQIYRQATRTIGYMGAPPPGKSADAAFRGLMWIGNVPVAADPKDIPADLAHPEFQEWYHEKGQCLNNADPPVDLAESLNDLFAGDWFLRSWVAQEMVLSRKVVCLYGYGSNFHALSLKVLHTLLIRTMFNRRQISAIRAVIQGGAGLLGYQDGKIYQVECWNATRNDLDKLHGGLGLPDLLVRTRDRKAADPRDKVYSLMGLMREGDRSAIRVDYSAGYSAANLLHDIAVHCIGSPEGHRLLSWAGLASKNSSNVTDLPSWVPGWTTTNPSPMPDTFYHASANLAHSLRILPDTEKQTIAVLGITVDAIAHLNPPVPVFGGDRPNPGAGLYKILLSVGILCERLQHLATHIGSTTKNYPFNNEPWTDVVWRTCCMDLNLSRNRRVVPAEDRACFEACLQRLGFGCDILTAVTPDPKTGTRPVMPAETFLDDTELEEMAMGFEMSVLSVQDSREIGTAGWPGLIGSFPGGTRVDDLVVVLLGVAVPVVLRPLGGGGHQLVGTCYVHGIMDGEWLKVGEGGQGRIVEFEIR